MSVINWTNSLVFELISLFEQKPALWDTSTQDYKNREKKHQSWLEIANAMNTDVDTVQKKMHMLVGQYRREQARNQYQNSKWFAFEKLKFLRPQRTVSRQTIMQRQPHVVTTTLEEPHCKMQRLEPPVPRMDLIRDLQKKSDNTPEKDEYTTYGELIAMKLRKIGNSFARSTVQYHINNILYKAEIGAYDVCESKRKSSDDMGASSSQMCPSPTKSVEEDSYKMEKEDSDDNESY